MLARIPLIQLLGGINTDRNEPQVHRALNVLHPFDSVSRDRLSSLR